MIALLRTVGLNRQAAIAFVLMSVRFSRPAAADPEIVGDATLLETVKDALERNQQALSQGECDIRLEYGQTADPLESGYSCSTKADVHLLWSGAQSYSSYTFSEDTIGDEWPERNAHGAQFIDGETQTVYVPEGELCESRPFRPSGFPTFRDVLPADICFQVMHYRDKPWTTVLVEATADEAAQWVDEIDVTQEEDVIRIKLIAARDAYTGLEFSVPQGCNLTSWETVGENGEKMMWGSHEWAEVALPRS